MLIYLLHPMKLKSGKEESYQNFWSYQIHRFFYKKCRLPISQIEHSKLSGLGLKTKQNKLSVGTRSDLSAVSAAVQV